MEYMIELNNVWKSFKRGEKLTALRDALPALLKSLTHRPTPRQTDAFWALKDISFKVKKAEIFGIIGPNGAGKTTILNLLAGIMKPAKGQIKTNGRISALIALGAGFHPEFTGRENIYINGAIIGMSKREIDKKFDSIVEFAGYGFRDYKKFIDTPIKRYSSGMSLRLGFAVAVHVEPDILLLDEILAVGDITFQQKCLEHINSIKKTGVTVIMVSHNLHHIRNYCDRAILLKNGRIAAQGEPGDMVEILERQATKESSWYGGRAILEPKPAGAASLSKVKIEQAREADGELVLTYQEPIDVSFDYNCFDYPLDDVAFSLAVYRQDIGCKCFAVFSHICGFFPKTKKGHISLTVKGHNLTPGDFVFDVEIRSLKGNISLAAHRESKIYIKIPKNKYIRPQFCGVYQPSNISWK